MGEYRQDQLDALFGAMADPTRRAIVARLGRGEARVTDIAAAFPISLNSVSKHLRILERVGLVVRSIHGREHRLSLQAGPLDEAAAWIQSQRQFWEAGLTQLDAFATALPIDPIAEPPATPRTGRAGPAPTRQTKRSPPR